MELGFVGLGKMGMNMVTRLQQGQHRVVAFDRDAAVTSQAATFGARAVASLEELVRTLATPRAVWVMVPAGGPTESTIASLADLLSPGDIIIDGGNTNFHDDIRRAEDLKKRGLKYVDVGTSGGVWGLKVGYCLMIGGDADVFRHLEPVFKTLAPPDGYLHTGGSGSGHYVKMVHNGIEYGMMQAYAEGFELMHKSGMHLNLPAVASLWMQGSVVRSWLLELTAAALQADPELKALKPYVQDSGEGRWTVQEAIDKGVPMPVITASLFTRFRSREENSYAERLLAAMRNQFGGHAVKTT
jgi:6-phosphogluconate dehydrogenase